MKCESNGALAAVTVVYTSKAVVILLALVLTSFSMAGCFSLSSGDDQNQTTTPSATATTATPAAIRIVAEADSINLGQSVALSATVLDAAGNGVADTVVYFSLDDPFLAVVTRSAVTSADGVASATLTANNLAGQVSITATAEDSETAPESTPKTITILDASAPAAIQLSANPTSVLIQGTATVTADVADAAGNAVPNGTTVVFSVDNPLFGTVSETALTNNGQASATFTAANQPGDANIAASSGSANASTPIEILDAPAAVIQFVSSVPDVIALAGSGNSESAVIKFQIKNGNSDPVSDINVTLSISGPNGGEYIDASGDDSTDEIVVSSDADGIVSATLFSGHVAGPVTISAAMETANGPISAKSSVISIGGGVPSDKRFSRSASVHNLLGLVYQNLETDITAYLADRFGNYNVLKGTTVSFACESGLAIDNSTVTLADDGLATVTARTQNLPEDVLPLPWEIELQDYLRDTYGYATDRHPRDGRCTVMIYTKGEEHFDDSNADGVYESGETFIDTDDDPYIDINGDGAYNAGPTTSPLTVDPEELYIDTAQPKDNVWSGLNDRWDANKYLFKSIQFLITGHPIILVTPTTFDIPNGGAQSFKAIVCDPNLNQLNGGSIVSINSDAGEVVGTSYREYFDSSAVGHDLASHLNLIEYQFQIIDDNPDEDTLETVVLQITAENDAVPFSREITGTIH